MNSLYSTNPGQNRLIDWAVLILFLLTLFYIELIPILGAGGPVVTETFQGMSPPERGAYFGYLFSQLPSWVNVWMHFQDCIIFGGIFFLFAHKVVRWYLFGVVLNHIILFALMPIIPEHALSLKFAAFTHFAWVPALIFFIKAWPGVDKRSPFGIWLCIAIFQLCFSLFFDIPQGVMWLATLFG